MFDIGAGEMLMIAVVAILVIGPKDLPRALRTAGQWIGKVRGMARHFQTGLDAMVREAELEEMEKKWKAENERIMREHPPEATPVPESANDAPQMEPLNPPAPETAAAEAPTADYPPRIPAAQPSLTGIDSAEPVPATGPAPKSGSDAS
jgi:sec-independent protein translocase protein TatB